MLNVGEALSYGWNKFVQYIGQIILIVLVIFVVQAVFFALSRIVSGGSGLSSVFLGGVISIIGWVVGLILQAGLIRAALAVTRGETPEVGMLFQTTNIGTYAVASILVGLLLVVGLLACLRRHRRGGPVHALLRLFPYFAKEISS